MYGDGFVINYSTFKGYYLNILLSLITINIMCAVLVLPERKFIEAALKDMNLEETAICYHLFQQWQRLISSMSAFASGEAGLFFEEIKTTGI
ncbi:hypothetical protein SAMN02745724_01977 [Pseudoalteromonas denitrificans DSM 6059]|uniref:Uncharacterized protein n=1 Tax=Pseudoalteromonas denitrificans DSM 6059 TaxID=1123010 RepID=A0A1I1K960_9GAMM|nr:hypothetical protein SAMN02745724_01977 [Pseudoalteromonas denitrificans DSM 6059]